LALGAIVLGMSRSGTSLASGALVAGGFYVGSAEDLMPASPANPAGYWENVAVRELNEQLLASVTGSWFTPPRRRPSCKARSQATDRVRAVFERLQSEAGGRPLVIKDPRIGVLLELWAPVIDGVLHPALAVRHPVEIALSLARREGIPAALALLSWELHTVRILEYLNGRRVTVVHYDDLLRVPEAAGEFVAATAERLAPSLKLCINAGAAPPTVNASLRHHDAASLDAAEHLTGRQARLWSFLSGLASGNQVLDVPSGLRATTATATASAGAEARWVRAIEGQLRFVDERAEHLDELRSLRVRAERAEAQTEHALAQAEHAHMTGEHAQARAEQAQAEAERAQAQAGQAQAQAELQRTRADRAEQTAGTAAQAAAISEQRYATIVSSRSWRVTASLRALAAVARRRRSQP
jgi:hypothetical protein